MSKGTPGPTGIYVRTTAAYQAWALRLARHCRRSRGDAIDAGLVLLARETGFDEPPPQRNDEPRRVGRKVEPSPAPDAA